MRLLLGLALASRILTPGTHSQGKFELCASIIL